MAEKSIIIIFGATGDLAKKKIIPALAALYKKEKLKKTPVVAAGRRVLSKEQYLKLTGIKENSEFAKNLFYIKTDLSNSSFSQELNEIDKKYTCNGNKIFYLATSSELFIPIIEFISKYGLINKNKIKFAFEKPFGDNLRSAKRLYDEISKLTDKDSIYFSDHYLGKDMIYEIPYIKKIPEIQKLWKEELIEHINISLIENFGIEGRGEYYDRTGAIKDVVQNHVMQIIALLEANNREDKAEIIRSLKIPNKDEVVIGQYEGYTSEEHVSPNSKTETFVKFKTMLRGIPFYVKAGKYLGKKSTDLVIKMKNESELDIHIGPDNEAAYIKQNNTTKKFFELKEKIADFENIILGLIEGNRSRFAAWSEIIESWKFVDALLKEAAKTKLYIYPKNSHGPQDKSES